MRKRRKIGTNPLFSLLICLKERGLSQNELIKRSRKINNNEEQSLRKNKKKPNKKAAKVEKNKDFK